MRRRKVKARWGRAQSLRWGLGAVGIMGVLLLVPLVAMPAVARGTVGEGTVRNDPGREIYRVQCQACHQASGEGIEGVFAPLAGSELVSGPEGPLLQVILDGRELMPGFAELLGDEEIAAVTSFIRQEWGTGAGSVTPEAVAAARGLPSQGVPADQLRDVATEAGVGPSNAFPPGWREEAAVLVEYYCAVCHQPEGQGVEGAYPPLSGNPVVMTAPGPLIQVVREGRGGMPRFGFLTPEELSWVLSYIRSSWGNQAPPITPEMVRGDL